MPDLEYQVSILKITSGTDANANIYDYIYIPEGYTIAEYSYSGSVYIYGYLSDGTNKGIVGGYSPKGTSGSIDVTPYEKLMFSSSTQVNTNITVTLKSSI